MGLQAAAIAGGSADGNHVLLPESAPAIVRPVPGRLQRRAVGPNPATIDGAWSPIHFSVRGAGPGRKYAVSATLTLTNRGGSRSRAAHVDISLEGNFVLMKRVPALEPGAHFRYTATRKNLGAAAYSAIIGKHFTATLGSFVFESNAIPAVP